MAAVKGESPQPGFQDKRYGRFGLFAGISVAVVLHIMLFALPSPKSFSKKEEGFQRGMVARAYRPAPLPSRGGGAGVTDAGEARARPSSEAPRKAASDTAPVRAVEKYTGEGPVNPAGRQDASGLVTRMGETAGHETGGLTDGAAPAAGRSLPLGEGSGGLGGKGGGADIGVSAGESGQGGGGTASGQAANDWDRVIGMLKDKREEIITRETRMTAEREQLVVKSTEKRGEAVKKAEEDKFLDPRIRISVVSYPPTPIEKKFPPIGYPDIRFKRSQMSAGICRVYLRVWTDAGGRVVRTELKAPSTRAEEEKYEPFVTAVKNEVMSWPFSQEEAQVHVDVLFEIK